MAEWNVGAKNGTWKGGRSVASNGYVLILVGTNHHLADVRGYAYEHRLVAEEKIGRRLRDDEQVHHVDGNKENNAPENLDVLTCAEHRFEHRTADRNLRMPGEPNPLLQCDCGCGEVFPKFDANGRPRRFVSGHNPMPAPSRDTLLRALQDGPRAIRDLATALETTPAAARCLASRLSKTGTIVRIGRGTYAAGGSHARNVN